MATVTAGGSGYVAPPTIKVAGTGKCSVFPTATATVENGIVKTVTLSGGTCTAAPTLTISAPDVTAKATVADNAATSVTMTEKWFGYIGVPDVLVTATAAVCQTKPTATATVSNGIVTGITLSGGFCVGRPTLTIDDPTIPAKATILTTGAGATMEIQSVRIDEKGAGYATTPAVTIVSTSCAVLPRPVVTMNGDKIASIQLVGAYKCTTVPTITIEAPNKIWVSATTQAHTLPTNVYHVNRVKAVATFTKDALGTVTANITKKWSGYTYPPKITSTGWNCPNGLTATTRIVKGTLESIALSGICTTLPTFTIPAPTSKAVATLNTDLTIKTLTSGSGYIAKPKVTVSGGTCTVTPTVQDITLTEWRVTAITMQWTCTKAPTLVIEDPEVPATATTTKVSTDNYTVNITNPGAGYVSSPRVVATGTCKLLPHARATVENGKVTTISLTGAEWCTGAITLTIDGPSQISVPEDVSS
jgi:hypothetical protein